MRKMMCGCVAAWVMAFGAPAWADGVPAARVARLTFAQGYVHIDRRDSAAGDPAQVNMPLVEGQTVVTGEDGQAEVEFEDGSVARVTPNSAVSLAHMSADGGGNFDTRLVLVKGLAYFELRAATKFAYSVEAAGAVVSPAENATVRVNLDEPPAPVAVLDGSVHLERAQTYRTDVRAGETFREDATGAGRYFLTQEIAPETWDQWNEARDQAASDAAAKQTTARDGYAGSQGYGWSDLDANGSWYDVPGQGKVWQPAGGDAADFDPYGDGSWMWYPGGGYLWASAYSWGWTPYRCGGWSFWNTFGWGWQPNAGCYGLGFAGYGGYGYYGGGYGYGGGGYVNVVIAPRGYSGIRLPNGTPGGGVHPIIPVHRGGFQPGGPRQGVQNFGNRQIAGAVATPVRPIGQAYTPRGGSAVGASLRRDFPVDRQTHAPVLGVQAGGGGVPANRGGTRSDFSSPGTQGGYGTVRQGFQPGTQQGVQQGYRQGGQQQSAPGTQQGLRPLGQPGLQPGIRPMPQPSYQQGMRPSGAPPASQGNFSRQPMQQSAPHYAAPAQMSRPAMSAPAAAPAMHSAPAPAASGGGGKKQ